MCLLKTYALMISYATWQLGGEVARVTRVLFPPPNSLIRLLWGMAILKCKGSDRLVDIPVQPINFSENCPYGQGPSLISQKLPALANDLIT